MPKFCANGHQMEDAWDMCPFCQRTGYQNAGGAGGAKTRLEIDSVITSRAGASAAAPGRKTVLLSERPAKRSLVGWLVAVDGKQQGEDFRVREGQNIIGSDSDADIVLQDETVSGKHASLRYKDASFYLTDLDSTNGTYLNTTAEAIAREQLKDNDKVRVGGVTLKFKAL